MHKHTPDKKTISLEIKYQLTQSLGYLKDILGEKKFNNRVDDAVKLFTKGFKKLEHAKEPGKKEEQIAVKPKATAEKKVIKKGAQKSEAAPKAVAAPKKQSAQKTTRKSPVKSAK